MGYQGYTIFQNRKFGEIYARALNKKRVIWRQNQIFITTNRYLGNLIGYLEFPIVQKNADLINEVKQFACKNKVAQLHIRSQIFKSSWIPYLQEKQGTYVIDLEQSEENLWANFEVSCRQKIKKAISQKVVVITQAQNICEFNEWYALYQDTARRKSFEAYRKFFLEALFLEEKLSSLFVAKIERKIVAGVFLLLDKYPLRFLAASNPEYNKFHPNNLLEWEIIKWAKKSKYFLYDLCQAEKTAGQGPSEFKRSFGGQFIDLYIYKLVTNWLRSKFIDFNLYFVKFLAKRGIL